jgi:uncharacterized membrane protein YphA (DoxX/SURF4 family)
VLIKPIGVGQQLFAISGAVFGIQYLQYGKYQGGLPPVPPWTPGGAAGADLVGIVLIATAVCLAINKKARLSALIIGGLFLFCVILLHLQHFSAVVHDGVARTRAFEPFALAGAAFVLAGMLPRDVASPLTAANKNLILFGRLAFGISMVIFGWQHFLYAAFLATLVPAWLPAHSFWIYFTGAGVVAAGLAIALNVLGSIAAAVLGLMFLLWVLVLHGPRVIAQPHNGDELSSLFVALAFCGASWIIAGALAATPRQGLEA